MNLSFVKSSLGSKETAEKIAKYAQENIPAYQQYLNDNNIKQVTPFDELPTSDKNSYILSYPYRDLLIREQEQIFTFFRSSGSSGNTFYWPQLKSAYNASGTSTQKTLEKLFSINAKKTLAVVGFNLGGWIAGDSLSWMLKNAAVNSRDSFWVVSPGNDIDEILKIIDQFKSSVEQIILFMVPSAITHLHLRASESNQSLPVKKIRYWVGGEPFPESLRTSLQNQAGFESDVPFMLSIYGAGDAGTLGFESVASVALRKLFCQNQELAQELGINFPIPHFFHFLSNDAFLEELNGNLCITQWQGIPLVRYIIYDRVSFFSWSSLRQVILSSNKLCSQDEPLVKLLQATDETLPNLIALTGRADSCLIIGGANLMEYMLDEAVKAEELNDILTGLYRAQVTYDEDNKQYLLFDLETRQDITIDQEKENRVYYSLINSLGKLEPYFLEAYRKLYSRWDNDPSKRILQLRFSSWPTLSKTTETFIKQRGIIFK